MSTIRKRAKRLRPRKVLRGSLLVNAALKELADTASWQTDLAPLTWLALAHRLGVSRQAIATKPVIKEAYAVAQERLQKAKVDTADPQVVGRRSLEERVASLHAEIEQFGRERDAWIERWVAVEHNCRLHGYDPDKLFAPLDKPRRSEPRGRSNPSKR